MLVYLPLSLRSFCTSLECALLGFFLLGCSSSSLSPEDEESEDDEDEELSDELESESESDDELELDDDDELPPATSSSFALSFVACRCSRRSIVSPPRPMVVRKLMAKRVSFGLSLGRR